MKLNFEEQEIYEGKKGKGLQAAMALLVAVGEVYEAEKMINISSAHVVSNCYKTSGEENIQWLTELIEGGAHFSVFTTLNPGSVDLLHWYEMGVSKKLVEDQRRLTGCYLKLGAIPINSCLPYAHGNAPRLGEHISWAGTSSAVFANSVLGGRGNREGGPSVVAAAVVGATPEYGLHFSEERRGQVIIDTRELDLTRFTLSDYSALGCYVGKQLSEKTPIFPYLPPNISQEQLRFLLSPMPSVGAVRIVHIVGVTPEAPTLEAALEGKEPDGKLEVGTKEIKETYEMLRTTKDDRVDLVAFGCPHCSYSLVQLVARMLEGKKVNSGVRLWVSTSEYIRSLAQKAGLVDIIEGAGGLVLSGMCIAFGGPYDEIEGVKVVVTNSARAAAYIRGKVDVIFGDTKQCISAAIRGKWEG